MPPFSKNLSKSKFCNGLQCLKQLWWRVFEPKAPELQNSAELQAVFDRGHIVGERARDEFPGGTLIGHEHWEVDRKVADTAAALATKTPAVFEAAIAAKGVYAAVDVLERCKKGHALVEVKSTTSVKDAHIPDVAIQLYALREAGLDVRRADLMHLNRDCRYPNLFDLFVREDVTEAAEDFLPSIPGHLKRMRKALSAKLPVVDTGPQCDDPYPCPFKGRCFEEVPEDHVSSLYYFGGKLARALEEDGVESIHDIPKDAKLSEVQTRQVEAVRSGKPVVEPSLSAALEELNAPVAFLDFETIYPAIPAWKGCGPFMHVPVQMSCHVVGARGAMVHHEFLADGPDDPRPAMAAAVVRACRDASTVLAHNASFERRALEHLAEHVPTHRKALRSIISRLVDLLPIVRDHVYHPDFGGSFGLKAVAPALVPGLDYEHLEIGDGATAAGALEGLLLAGDQLAPGERKALRKQLLAYCEQDTLAMVKVVAALRALVTRTTP